MKAEVISIGTEITTGLTLNTNTRYISKNLLDLGIETVYQTSVDDDYDRLNEVFEIALSRSDLIITTGGLGPTEDDFTKEILAEHLGLDLIMDEKMKEEIISRFPDRNKVPENNFKQAKKIKGSRFLFNSVGTAPGSYVEFNGVKIILLPGPPREMEPMFQEEVIPLLKGEDLQIITRSINITGLGESLIEMEIKDLIHLYNDIEIATFGKIKNVEIRIIARGKDRDLLEYRINHIIEEIEDRFKDNIYAYDNENIEYIVFKRLEELGLKIAFAESCTGGLLSGRFVRMPGVSSVLDRSFVTYSNKAKIEELGVRKETLESYGAVSEETAIEMVGGLLKKSSVDLAVSVTGILGPKSDDTNKPVGLVYISVGDRKSIETKELNLKGDRKNLQDRVVENAFFLIREFLIKNY